MPKKNAAGKCTGPGCCGVCPCNLRTMYLTIYNVALNASPTMRPCGPLAPFGGYTPDPAWYNGVTFIFNPEWDTSALIANNPNAYSGGSMVATQCVSQGGNWVCSVPSYPLPGAAFFWTVKVEWSVVSGKFQVLIILGGNIDRGGPLERSETELRYRYDDPCPIGSYSLFSRTNTFNAGSFDFTAATADIVWA